MYKDTVKKSNKHWARIVPDDNVSISWKYDDGEDMYLSHS